MSDHTGDGVDEGWIHDEVAVRLAAQDQRYTSSRRSIVGVLARIGRPLNIVELLGEVPGMPQSSAYRTLTVLADAGVVRRVAGSDDLGRFELAEDLAGHHHHLVCSSCGKVEDLTASARIETVLHEVAEAAAEEYGYEVAEHRLDIVGRCPECRLR